MPRLPRHAEAMRDPGDHPRRGRAMNAENHALATTPRRPAAGCTVPRTRGEIDLVWCVTVDGVSVALPSPFVAMHLARGVRRIPLGDVLLEAEAAARSERQPLTVTEAARLLMHDFPHLSLETATARVSYAARIGRIASTGEHKARRLAADSFDAWRLGLRDKDLDKAERGTGKCSRVLPGRARPWGTPPQLRGITGFVSLLCLQFRRRRRGGILAVAG